MKKSSGKIYYFLVLVALLVVFVGIASSCSTANNTTGQNNSINGAWASTTASPPYDDWFDVSGDSPSEFVYYKNGDPTNDVGIRGQISNLVYTDKQSGYIVYRVTYSNLWADLTVDEYSVMQWKDNDGASCKSSSQPYKGGFSATKPTAAEAVSEFTVANGYYDYLDSSNYSKK